MVTAAEADVLIPPGYALLPAQDLTVWQAAQIGQLHTADSFLPHAPPWLALLRAHIMTRYPHLVDGFDDLTLGDVFALARELGIAIPGIESADGP